MLRFFIFFLLIQGSFIFYSFGQNGYTINITGQNNINPGTTYTYSVEWKYNGSPTSPPSGGTYNWTVYGGTAHSSGNTYAAIVWNNSGSILYEYNVNGNYYYATFEVSNNNCAPTPNLSFNLETSTCAPRELSYSGNPPSQVTWYWQTTPNGTSKSNSGNSYNVFSPGTYYVRPYNSTNSCWGVNAVSYTVSTVTNPPSTPGLPTIINNNDCGSKVLEYNGSPSGVTSYWQGTNPNGTSTSYSDSELYLVQTTGRYYLRARNNSSGCWSENSSSVFVTINDIPNNPPSPYKSSNSCGPKTLSKPGAPTEDVTWYWQGKNYDGKDYTSDAAKGATYEASESGTYYLRGRHENGCWSSPSSVSVIVNDIPSTPAIPNASSNSCGPKTISYTGTPPTGVTWYWQGTNPNGTSTSNSSSTIVANVDGTYYLRARNNDGGCWSENSSSVQVYVNDIPETPNIPDVSDDCGPRILSKTGAPSDGSIWYWQGTNANGTDRTSSVATSDTYTVNTSGTYYLRAFKSNSHGGCWSSPASVSVTINSLPETPNTPIIANDEDCGSKALIHDNSHSGVTWYWQGENSNGMSTENSETYLAQHTGTYYLRAQDNITGCWSQNSSSIYVFIDVPGAPTVPTISSNSCGPITLSKSGNSPAGISWYWQGINAYGTDHTSAIAMNDTYEVYESNTYYLRSLSNNGCWGESVSIQVNVNIPPTPSIPQGLSVTDVTTTSFIGHWSEVSNADNYIVEIATDNTFSEIVETFSTSNTSFPIVNLFPGGTFFWRVRALKECVSSSNSGLGPISLIPPAPLATEATYINTNSFFVNWMPSNGATEYYFDISTKIDFSSYVYQNIKTSSFDGFTGDPNGSIVVYNNIFTESNTYYYRIRAANNSGQSTNSNIITVLPLIGPPTALNASDITRNSFTASWTNVSGALEYRLDISTDKEFDNIIQEYNDLPVEGTSLSITGLNPGRVYYYRLRSWNSSGSSDHSNVITTVTLKDYNYVREFSAVMPLTELNMDNFQSIYSAEELNIETNYFGGLGQIVQTVNWKASAGLDPKDVVQPFGYDDFGRRPINYLPYVSYENNGGYKDLSIGDGIIQNLNQPLSPTKTLTYQSSQQYQFYTNDQNNNEDGVVNDTAPYSEVVFENSPLNRPIIQGAPGETWQPSTNHTKKFIYQVNIDNEVALWKIDSNEQLVIGENNLNEGNPYFSGGTLYKKIIEDEEGNKTIEYTNKQNQTILKKVQVADDPDDVKHEGWACTYYIYDDFNNLRYILQPQLIQNFVLDNGDSFSVGFSPSITEISNYSFQYKYDGRSRMTHKKVPGADWVYLVYDDRDRLVLTQDGNQRSTEFGATSGKEWTFTKYDAFNRPVMTGIYTHSGMETTQETMQVDVVDAAIVSGTDFYEEFDESTGNHGYTNRTFPTSDIDILSITYYDNYNFVGESYFDAEGLDFTYEGNVTTIIDEHPTTENMLVRDQVTGSKVRVLDPQGGTKYLNTVTYYDDKYRVIQTLTENHLEGIERLTNVYDDLTQNIKESITQSFKPEPLTVRRRFTYDQGQRLVEIKHCIGCSAESEMVTLVSNEYNELGELISKNLNKVDASTSWQTVDYQYNIRGWLTAINDANLSDANDLFGMELYYTNGFETSYYNGNISGVKWKSAVDEDHMAYGYRYDKMNRIINAHYVKGNREADDSFDDEGFYNMEIFPKGSNPSGYDLNGNILNLTRYGVVDGNHTAIDVLSYDYTGSGNQLNKVDDIGTDEGFKDGSNNDNDYAYDANGNMKIDQNKGIAYINYNFLNLPREIFFKDGRKIEYVYNAAGIKLAQRIYEDETQAATKTTDYIGERVYEQKTEDTEPQLQFIHHEEGQIIPSNSNSTSDWEYQYHLKDHLGNSRLTFGKTKTAEYLLTMEIDPVENRILEAEDFDNVYESEDNLVPQLNHTPVSAATPDPQYVIKLNGGDDLIGPSKSIKVLPGDQIEIEVYAKYLHLDNYDPSVAGDALLSGFMGAFMGAGSEFLIREKYVDEGLLTGLENIANNGNDYEGVPQAYLNYILFDNKYEVIEGKKLQISEEGKFVVGDSVLGTHEHMQIDPINITKEGYIYIYLSNQTPDSEVYFDDLYIKHTLSRIIKKEDFYPFGLNISSLTFSRENEVGSENGLGWNDLGFRQYDPVLGRFAVVDPLAELQLDKSPYQYAANNPINNVDVLGLKSENWIKDLFEKVIKLFSKRQNLKGTSVKVTNNSRTGRSGKDKEDTENSGEGNENHASSAYQDAMIATIFNQNHLNSEPDLKSSEGRPDTRNPGSNSLGDRFNSNSSDNGVQSSLKNDIRSNDYRDTNDRTSWYKEAADDNNPTLLASVYNDFNRDKNNDEGILEKQLAKYDRELAKRVPYLQRLTLKTLNHRLHDPRFKWSRTEVGETKSEFKEPSEKKGNDDQEVIQLMARQVRDSYVFGNKIRVEIDGDKLLNEVKIGLNTVEDIWIDVDGSYDEEVNFQELIGEKEDHLIHKSSGSTDYYGIKLGDLEIFFIDDAIDRDIFWDFITGQSPEYDYSSDENVTLDGKNYSFKTIVENIEQIRKNLQENGTYNDLDEDGKLILDLPIIEWGINWKYSSIFIYNWLIGGGDVHFDDFENSPLVKKPDPLFKLKFDQAIEDMKDQDNFFITDNQKSERAKLFGETISLPVGGEKEIRLGDNMSYFYNSRADMLEVARNFGDMAGSFGRFNLLFSYTGTVKKMDENTAEVIISKVYYRVIDQFDFEGFQPLGGWEQDVYQPNEPTWLGGNSLTNASFRDFNEDTNEIGQDFEITTSYVEIPKPFVKIILHLDNETTEVIYE